MRFDWGEYLALARELSQRGDEAAQRTAISRAYYSAFHTARTHRGSRIAIPSQDGSHRAVWNALKRSGNANWRKAGNQGGSILEYRRMADYDSEVRQITAMAHSTIRIATEILALLGE